MSGRRHRGQASVELALVLPLLLGLVLLLGEVGLVVKDYVLVAHAAREGVRAATVAPDDPEAARIAVGTTGGLTRDRLSVRTHRRGPLIDVIVSYRHATNVRFLGPKLREIPVSMQVTGHVED